MNLAATYLHMYFKFFGMQVRRKVLQQRTNLGEVGV